jgi:hypothetical protein
MILVAINQQLWDDEVVFYVNTVGIQETRLPVKGKGQHVHWVSWCLNKFMA